MLPLLPCGDDLPVASALVLAYGGLAAVALPRAPGRLRAVALATATALALEGAAHAAWALGATYPQRALGATVATASVVFGAVLLPAIALGLALFSASTRLVPRRPETTGAPSLSRRAFVAGAATASATLPAAVLATTANAFARANDPPLVPRLPLAWPDLPPALHGLRILHLSDLHLGLERHARDVEALVEGLLARRERIDLVALTGDVAEHPEELAPAVRALEALGVPLVASLGNHEYLMDITRSRRAIDRARLPLLVDAGTTLRLRGHPVHVTGLDDPVLMHGDVEGFAARALDRALDGAPREAFHLVLSHRPEALVPAAERGMDLVLSGHTHGGQIGFSGRSAFERIWPERYLWGPYARGATRLYTTSGFGHWFPLRARCPTEAPILELVRA